MATGKHYTGKASSMAGGLAVGTSVSMLTTVLSAMLLAKMLDAEKLQWGNVGYGIMAAVLAAAFLGAVTACGKIKRKRALVCLLTGSIYYLLLLSLTALFFGGQYDGAGVTAGLVLGGCGSACLLIMPRKNPGKGSHSRKYYR